MIRKIEWVKNLGIFGDFKWNSDIPDLKRYNLIYGWTGSGKTTLSRLLSSLETGKTELYPDLEYKIITDDGIITQDSQYNRRIRVFNRDYISDNIEMSCGKAKPIFILGKENKQLVDEIKQDEKILNGDPDTHGYIGKIKELETNRKELEQKEKNKGKLFTDVAKVISSNTSGVTTRTYRKNNAETTFKELQAKQLLTDDEINNFSLTLKQQEKPILETIQTDNINNNIVSILERSEEILKQTIDAIVIYRLKENPDISEWVESGLDLHEKHKSSICEFCNQSITMSRITDLGKHFNDDDKILKNDINNLIKTIDQIQEVIINIYIKDKAYLYDELQKIYVIKAGDFEIRKKQLLSNISLLKKEIVNKKNNTLKSLSLNTIIEPDNLFLAIKELNNEISKHNKKSKAFQQAKDESSNKIEKHYLSEMYDEVKQFDLDILKIKNEISLLENGDPDDTTILSISQIQQRIIDNKNKVSNSGRACEEINQQLKAFLGRDELIFEIADEGYIIKRHGKIASNLSEGEKTAIAFVYFTIHLKDHNFDKNNGIIVIDDPICSLDANSMFQAFAFLKNAVENTAQVIIFTHNYDFLKLLINWMNHIPEHEYYMIKNPYHNNIRCATLEPRRIYTIDK